MVLAGIHEAMEQLAMRVQHVEDPKAASAAHHAGELRLELLQQELDALDGRQDPSHDVSGSACNPGSRIDKDRFVCRSVLST